MCLVLFFFSSRRRHTRCALVTGVQTCALPILMHFMPIALWQVDASGMGKLYADLKSKGVADFERYLEDHPNLVEFAAATVPVTDVNRSAVQMMGGASVQDLIQPLGYLFEESPDSLRRVMIGRFSGRKNYKIGRAHV